ncbi:MAG: YdeI/OmpD-associated family protein, partial [Maritimibacter sp.]
QGPNTKHPDSLRFTGAAEVADMAPVIAAYIEEAQAYAEAGILPPKDTSAPDLPNELSDALDGDAELAEAFHALTPGRQKSYVINLNGAKKPETRLVRIEKFRDQIIAGKGANER